MKRIVYVTDVSIDGKSGQNISTKEVISAFGRNEKIELFVVAPKPIDKSTELYLNASKYFYLPTKRRKSAIWTIKSHFIIKKFLKRVIKEYKVDAIVCRQTISNSPAILAKKYKIPYFLLVRG